MQAGQGQAGRHSMRTADVRRSSGGLGAADLLDHERQELRRDQSEGLRIAYVAATRARDLLVVPAVGDGTYEGGWVNPLNDAIYPP